MKWLILLPMLSSTIRSKVIINKYHNIINIRAGFSSNSNFTSTNTTKEVISEEINESFVFTVKSNEIAYKGWRNMVKREIIQPNGRVSTYDIVSTEHSSIGVFIWNEQDSTTTLIREYHPGIGKFLYGIVGGMYESKKHKSSLECAQFELDEEAHLRSSRWIPLLTPTPTAPHSSTSSSQLQQESTPTYVSFDKYSDNTLYPYIALNCITVSNPRPLDDDEFIVIERHVTYKRLIELLNSGQMNIFSSYVVLLALRKLEELGIHIDKSK